MINKMEISGVHTEVTPELKKYLNKKIGKLDQYMPSYALESAHAEIKLKEQKIKSRVECSVEVAIFLPKETIIVKETTVNMFAAIDVVEEKLKNQIKKYKQTHGKGQLRKEVLAKVKRSLKRG